MDAAGGVPATAQKRHNHSLTAICRHLEDIGALRDDVDARLATRTITWVSFSGLGVAQVGSGNERGRCPAGRV